MMAGFRVEVFARGIKIVREGETPVGRGSATRGQRPARRGAQEAPAQWGVGRALSGSLNRAIVQIMGEMQFRRTDLVDLSTP